MYWFHYFSFLQKSCAVLQLFAVAHPAICLFILAKYFHDFFFYNWLVKTLLHSFLIIRIRAAPHLVSCIFCICE